jgi:hypothetical protein
MGQQPPPSVDFAPPGVISSGLLRPLRGRTLVQYALFRRPYPMARDKPTSELYPLFRQRYARLTTFTTALTHITDGSVFTFSPSPSSLLVANFC